MTDREKLVEAQALIGEVIAGMPAPEPTPEPTPEPEPEPPPALPENPALASRTSGVAPLAVFFDSFSDGQEFLESRYEWDFGDELALDWPDGWGKRWDVGPIAGHVYDFPGTYVATLNGSQQVTITVEDPDQVFPGEQTVCISQAGDFTGAPPGAKLITTSDWTTVVGQIASGRRITLRRGETWQATSTVSQSLQGPGILGAFGDPALPRPRILHGSQALGPNALHDWRIMDLDFDGQGSDASRAFRAQGSCSQALIYRCRARNVHTGFTFATSQLATSESFDTCSIVSCEVDGVIGGSGGYASMFAGSRGLFLGNRFQNSESAEHILRAHHLQGSVIAHNSLGRPAASKHVLKLHGLPWTGTYQPGTYTERIHLHHNHFSGGFAAWVAAICPEDDHTDQRIRTVLIEGNRLDAGVNMGVAFMLSGEGILARNNVLNGSGGKGTTGFQVFRRGIEPPPSGVKILHNTVYTADPDRFTLAAVSAVATGVTVRGNLGSAPASTQKVIVSGPATSEHNLLSDQPGFVDAPVDFSLLPGSPAVDLAPPCPGVWDDHVGRARGAQFDCGAFEVA